MAAQVRVATFNCEWRRSASADAAIIKARVTEGQTDVVCLTEAYDDFFEGEGHTISAEPHRSDGHAARRKVLLWSRQPWKMTDRLGSEELPPGRFVSGRTFTPAGEMTVVGVCIPYRWSGRREVPKLGIWDAHLKYLSALDLILPSAPERTLVLGDFNQRIPAKYQPQRVYAALEQTLLLRLRAATRGDIPGLDRQAIDHICHSRDMEAADLTGLSNAGPGGRPISDHFGVRCSLRIVDG